MHILCLNPPTRPPNVEYDSICTLYEVFEQIFLGNGRTPINSSCGHTITLFDHHFFHLTAITVSGKAKLFMRDEKSRILATKVGFADYVVGHNGSRAKNLRAVRETLEQPDEVWKDNPKTKSRWVYIKQYAAVPYPFSVVLLTQREHLYVPVTGFPCKKSDIRKWRKGEKVFP